MSNPLPSAGGSYIRIDGRLISASDAQRTTNDQAEIDISVPAKTTQPKRTRAQATIKEPKETLP